MYVISAALTVFISVCVARVRLNGRASSDAGGPSTGLPLGNLSISSGISSTSAGALRLPVSPFIIDPPFDIKFTFEPASGAPAHRTSFEGGELISSILFQLLKFWKDVPNAQITQKIDARDGPFSIWHTIQPTLKSQIAQLTPVIVGIAYCQMLNALLEEQNWPGHITADITNYGPGYGTIDIKDSLAKTPLLSPNSTPGYRANLVTGNRTLSIITSSNNTNPQIQPLLQTRAEREKTWLQIFSGLVFYVVCRPSLEQVPWSPSWPPSDYHPIPIWPPGEEWQIMLKISPHAGDVTWESVAAATMNLIIVATTQDT